MEQLKADRDADIAKRDATINELRAQVSKIQKARAVPATVPADVGGEKQPKGDDDDASVVWSSDMNSEYDPADRW